MAKKITAHVPIKRNSRRLPAKNFLDFNGEPLYYWIFLTLVQTDLIDEIYLNTDSEIIIEDVEQSFDISIIERPEKYRGQHVSMNDILVHDSNIMSADIYVHVHCTAPLLQPATINLAIEKFLDNHEYDSLLTGKKQKKWFYDSGFEPINHDPQKVERSQDLEPIYEEDGILYIIPHGVLNENKSRVGRNPMIYELPPVENIEIDYKYEFEKAEFFHKKRAMEDFIKQRYGN
jgi:N-acylneuraminate cytidylyltransferase